MWDIFYRFLRAFAWRCFHAPWLIRPIDERGQGNAATRKPAFYRSNSAARDFGRLFVARTTCANDHQDFALFSGQFLQRLFNILHMDMVLLRRRIDQQSDDLDL